MCENCWREYGAPKIVTDETKQAARLIDAVNPYGYLHIIVDDWNLGASDLRFCEAELNKNSKQLPDTELTKERDCLTALKALTHQERVSAMAIHDAFFPV